MNSQANQKWTLLELAGLVEDEDAHVCVKKATKHLALHPYYLDNVRKALNNILGSSRNTYDAELDGFILDFKTPKLLGSRGQIFYDAPFIHVDIEADFYLFRPTVGCILKGVVNKKGIDHVIMLVHKMFTVSIPKPYNVEEWLGDLVEVDQQIRCHLTEINKWSKPPYICGTLKADYLEGCRLPESVINNIDNVSVAINNEELSERESSFSSNKSSDRHVQKKSKQASTVLNTDFASQINGENTRDVNTPYKEKKKDMKKHTKSRDSDLECASRIKQEKKTNNNDTSYNKNDAIDNINNAPTKRKKISKEHAKCNESDLESSFKIKKEKHINDVNNTFDENKQTNPKKRTRIPSESDIEIKSKIKKENSIINNTTNTSIKEVEKNLKKRVKVSKYSDAESTSEISRNENSINAFDTENKHLKEYTKSRDSTLEFAVGIKKEKNVDSDKERMVKPKKRARILSVSDAEIEVTIKKEKDTSSSNSIIKNSPFKEIEKHSKKHIKTCKDSDTESISKVSRKDIFSDASTSSSKEKKSRFLKHKKSIDSNIEATFKIKKEKDVSDVNNTSDEEGRKTPKKHARISTDSCAELQIKIKKERTSS